MLKLYAADQIPGEELPESTGGGVIYAADDIKEEDPRDVLSQTVLDTAYGAAQGLTYNTADEIYGGGKTLLSGGSYEQNRDLARDEWSKARERTPIGTMAGEVGGSMMSPANKLFSGASTLRNIGQGLAQGAMQSYGATDKETLSDQAKETLIGGGIGAATGGISNVLSSKFSKSPTAIRSEVLGVKGRDYRVDGPADRKKIVQRISDSGMLKNRKMEYNPNTLKFEPRNKSKMTLDEIEKNTEERLLDRAEDATTKLQVRKIRQFGEVLRNTKISPWEIDNMAKEIASEYSKRGLTKGPYSRMESADKIARNIKDQLNFMKPTNPQSEILAGGVQEMSSLMDLDAVKRMAQEDVKNFSKSLSELGDNEELARITARKLKKLVENKVGSEDFSKINSAQHDFLTIEGDLKDKIKSLELENPGKQGYGKTDFINSFVDRVSGGSKGRLENARMKELYQGLPSFLNPAKAVIPYAAQEVPGTIYREKAQGGMGGNWRTINSMGSDELTPMQIAKMRLPRTTKGLLENKDLVLQKLTLSGASDEIVDSVAQALNDDPEAVEAIGAMVAMQFPTLFAKSKYGMFDGKILDPGERAKAADDTSKRNDIGSVQRAKIISELNKSGKYIGE